MSISIVIDTDIVRSASVESESTVAQECASILDAIRKGDYLVAMSNELQAEWFKKRKDNDNNMWNFYASRYAAEWLTEMLSRNRVVNYKINSYIGEDILRGYQNNNDIFNRVKKDLHVVLTAISADKRLISRNRRERAHFAAACAWASHVLTDLLWPLPLSEVLNWLANGAPVVQKYKLCK